MRQACGQRAVGRSFQGRKYRRVSCEARRLAAQYQGFQQEQPSQQDPYVSQVGGNMSGGYGGYGGGGDTKMGDYIRNLMKQRGSGFYSGREAGGMA